VRAQGAVLTFAGHGVQRERVDGDAVPPRELIRLGVSSRDGRGPVGLAVRDVSRLQCARDCVLQ
jgi:hypothetical protein